MCFALSISFLLCLLRENFHGFCPQQLLFYFPQRIYTMSLREGTTDFAFNGFTFSSPQRIFTVSLRERTTDFAFNGCTLCIFPEDLHPVSSKETEAPLNGF